MDNREERIDRNQAAYEALNTRLRRIAAKLRRWRDFQVICECGEFDCSEQIQLSPAEYQSVRAEPTCSIVVAGHQRLELERVVSRQPGYLVVQRDGEAVELAGELEPDDRAGP